jgi:hypothetical protein
VALTANGNLVTRQNLSVAGTPTLGAATITTLLQVGINARGMRVTPAGPSFNHDNIPDFAFLNVVGQVVTYAGQTSGAVTFLSTSSNPNYVGIAVEDFDADGFADVYGVTQSGNLYFIRTSSTTYTMNTPVLEGSIPSCVAAGMSSTTINDQKWLSVTCDDPPRSVLFQAGTSNFYNIPHAMFASLNLHDRTQFADFSNDGQMDFVVSNTLSGHVTTSLYDSSLAHLYQGADQNVPALGGAIAMALASFPGGAGYADGLLDAVVCDPNAGNGAIQYTGDGAGDFTYDVSVSGSYSGVDAADFDRNGDDDAVFIESLKLGFKYYNSGVGAGALNLHQQPNRVVAVDVNNDQWPDIVAIAYGKTTFDYALNAKSSTPFSGNANASPTITGNVVSYAFGDINLDGYKDMVIGTSARTLAVYSFRAGAPALFAITANQYAAAQALTDVNEDGVLELITISDQNMLSICTTPGNGVFTCTTTGTAWAYAASDQLLAYDFTQDGMPDVAVPALGGSYVGFWIGNANDSLTYLGTGTFSTSPGQARLGDVDNDGRVDLSMSCNANNATNGTTGPGVTRTIFTGFSR